MSFEQSCYLFKEDEHMDWMEGNQYCSLHHRSHLVNIETQSENIFVTGMCERLANDHSGLSSFWTGGSDSDVDGVWEWYPDNIRFTFTNWQPGEPSGSYLGGDEDCLMLHANRGFLWNDERCATRLPVICELSLEAEVIGK